MTFYICFVDEVGSELEVFIPYISRGFLSSLADARPVMELISQQLKNSPYSFVINSYALIDETKPIMYETTFLKEIAEMNFKKFGVEMPPENKIKNGLMVALNSTDNLSFTLNGIYNVLSKPDLDAYSNIYISLPHFDFISKDTHVSVSKAYLYRDLLLGVVGVDISFFDLAENVVHYDHSENSYAFMMDAHSGKLLYHPILSRFSRANSKRQNKQFGSNFFTGEYSFQNSYINVEHIEQAVSFPEVKRLIMKSSTGKGKHTIKSTLHHDGATWSYFNESNGNFLNDWQLSLSKYTKITYHWRRVKSSPYVVVLAVYESETKRTESAFKHQFELIHAVNVTSNETSRNPFISHRLDDLPEDSTVKLCKHFNQLATLDKASLYLTSTAFVDPYNYEVLSESAHVVTSFVDYLTEVDQDIANPGFNPSVRGDVHIAGKIVNEWKQLISDTSSETSKYTIRKYLATVSGAFMAYPGALLDSSYDHQNRHWYRRAILNPGKLIFTPPYLDIGGGGYIVTLSQTVSRNGQAWAVMGIDLTLGYFHKIIDEMVPICNTGNKASCFIMDDYGYLIVHSSFLKPSLSPFIERQHITHKEPQMINDLLNQKSFARKLVCNSFMDRTIQRYYMFNTSMVGILTNIVHQSDSLQNECVKYKIVTLDTSNVFFGIVNHTCDNSTTFCPCSLTDRLCLNCHRMEQTDCECPCECPLIMNLCDGQLLEKEDKNPSCAITSESLRAPSFPKYLLENLDTCVKSECSNKHSERYVRNYENYDKVNISFFR